jgi:hypothetical protein
MEIVSRVKEILRLTEKFPTHDMGRAMKFDELTVCTELKDNKKLYRFMSFKRFNDLISNKILFFSKASKLSDKFEGGHVIRGLEKECDKNRDLTFVSCWTANNPRDDDSLFMWRPYDNKENCIECENHIAIGISIKTFFIDRCSSCLFQDKKFEKYIGKIDYVPPDREDYPENYKTNSFVPFFIKRDYFEVENEIRIVIQDMVPGDSFFSFNKYKVLDDEIVNGNPFKGIRVRIDLHKIDEFIISPVADPSIIEDIKLCIINAGLDISKLKPLTEPSDKALEKAIKEVERLDKSNYKSLNNFENYKESKILREEYLLQDSVTDQSGNTVALRGRVNPSWYAVARVPENPSGATLRLLDASGNIVVYKTEKSNDFTHKKFVQQCQCYERDTNIKLNQ